MLEEERNHIEFLGKQVVDIAYHIHKALGPGLLEKVYESCFCYELTKRQISFIKQKRVPVVYDGVEFEDGLRLDILVWEAQLLSYLRLSNKHLGYIINFTVPLIKDGIKRMVL